jgi:excisionase family DNA binding protein
MERDGRNLAAKVLTFAIVPVRSGIPGALAGAVPDRRKTMNRTTEPLAMSPGEAARLTGVGRTTIYAALATGALCARKVGRRTLITREDLSRWLSNLPRVPVRS